MYCQLPSVIVVSDFEKFGRKELLGCDFLAKGSAGKIENSVKSKRKIPAARCVSHTDVEQIEVFDQAMGRSIT